jgi:hypothetical protein
MFGKDATDYGKLKEDRRQDREDTKYIESCFKLGIGNNIDKMLDVVKGRYHAPSLPDEPDKITASIRPGGPTRKTASRDLDEDEGDVDYRSSAGRSSGGGSSKYAEVFNELQKFRFSSDETKAKRQLSAVAKAVRAALQSFVPTEVFNNTKKKFGDFVRQGFQIKGGVKIEFAIGKGMYHVSARGAFYGDEVIAIMKTDEGKLRPSVHRLLGDDDDEDVSSEYAIELTKA